LNKIYKHYIDEGHGGKDPGAMGSKGTHEANHNLDIGKIVGRILTEQGQQVVHTRTTDKWLSLDERADIANKNLCNTFISIHCNSFKDPKANGTEVWSYPGSIEGMKLSKVVQEELVKATGLTNRGSKEARFGVLRMSYMTAILVETAFISNEDEELLLMQPEFKEKVAKAIVKGLFRYLNLEFKEKFSVGLKVVNEAVAMTEKPIKIFKVNDNITAVGEEEGYWILDINGKKAYLEKNKTIKR
jgi:N-acetylmuramoyl-L-alanine amidase